MSLFKKSIKAQSAMEYLMTYGWSILIIGIVLVALFALGVFGSGNGLPNSCIAQSGFVCSQVLFTHSTTPSGNLKLTIGQATGRNWAQANIIFLNSSLLGSAGLPATYTTANGANVISNNGITNAAGVGYVCNCFNSNGLVSGSSVTITLPINGIPGAASSVPVGTSIQGQVWAMYQTSTTTTTQYFAELGTVTAKAV